MFDPPGPHRGELALILKKTFQFPVVCPSLQFPPSDQNEFHLPCLPYVCSSWMKASVYRRCSVADWSVAVVRRQVLMSKRQVHSEFYVREARLRHGGGSAMSSTNCSPFTAISVKLHLGYKLSMRYKVFYTCVFSRVEDHRRSEFTMQSLQSRWGGYGSAAYRDPLQGCANQNKS
eukprot:5772588-Amphidinium_carterae.2